MYASLGVVMLAKGEWHTCRFIFYAKDWVKVFQKDVSEQEYISIEL